jgi:hypothetical protein
MRRKGRHEISVEGGAGSESGRDSIEAKLTIRAVNTSRLPRRGIGRTLDLTFTGNTLPLNNGKNSHEHICDSLELFAREVMPEFRADPEHDAWKAGVMSGAIQLEEIDTEAFKDRYGKLAVNVAKSAVAAAR